MTNSATKKRKPYSPPTVRELESPPDGVLVTVWDVERVARGFGATDVAVSRAGGLVCVHARGVDARRFEDLRKKIADGLLTGERVEVSEMDF